MHDPMGAGQIIGMPERSVFTRIVWRRDEDLLEGAEHFHAKAFLFGPSVFEGHIDALPDQIDVLVIADYFNTDVRVAIDERRDDNAQKRGGEPAGRRYAQQSRRFMTQLPNAADG